MIKMNKRLKKILSAVLLAALLISALPTFALADSSFSAAVKVKSMKVYADANGRNYLGSLAKKTVVTVKARSGGIARISYNGMTGYAKASDMISVESFADEAKTTKAARIYQEANTASASVKVKAGTKLYVLAVKKGVAMVEKGGKVGYMDASCLKLADGTSLGGAGTGSGNTVSGEDVLDALPDSVVDGLPDSVVEDVADGEYTTEQLQDLLEILQDEYQNNNQNNNSSQNSGSQGNSGSGISFADAYASGKYSNEQLCFLFAKQVMGYNTAAAAGLLSNISAESGFRVNANGDSGQSYGICQWYSSRKTRLINWCKDNGLDYTTLGGQLYFLKYELEKHYPSVHRYMKNVDNSAQGAYDAGYYFCYHFEAPANKASKSAARGNTAKNTYFPKYS